MENEGTNINFTRKETTTNNICSTKTQDKTDIQKKTKYPTYKIQRLRTSSCAVQDDYSNNTTKNDANDVVVCTIRNTNIKLARRKYNDKQKLFNKNTTHNIITANLQTQNNKIIPDMWYHRKNKTQDPTHNQSRTYGQVAVQNEIPNNATERIVIRTIRLVFANCKYKHQN